MKKKAVALDQRCEATRRLRAITSGALLLGFVGVTITDDTTYGTPMKTVQVRVIWPGAFTTLLDAGGSGFSTNAIPLSVSAGILAKNASKAANPPAEAPIPTIGNPGSPSAACRSPG